MKDYLSTALTPNQRYNLKRDIGQENYVILGSLIEKLDQFEGDEEEELIMGDWMDTQGQATTLEDFKQSFFYFDKLLQKNFKTSGELFSIVKNILTILEA